MSSLNRSNCAVGKAERASLISAHRPPYHAPAITMLAIMVCVIASMCIVYNQLRSCQHYDHGGEKV